MLRWFTPTQEVKLCGHATLAAAAALWMGEDNTTGTLYFDTVRLVRATAALTSATVL